MKNKHQILKMTLFIFVIMFTYSCSNENSIQQESKNIPVDFTKMNIGELHNQYMIKSYSKIKKHFNGDVKLMRSMPQKILQQQCAEIIIDEYSSIPYDPTPIGYSHDQFMEKAVLLVDNLSALEYDIRNCSDTYLNATLTENAYQYVERMLDIVQNYSTLQEIYNGFNVIEADANRYLTGNDLTIVKGTIAISRSSAYLWAPESQGGYDLYTKTFGTLTPVNIKGESYRIRQLTWWQKAILGDMSASAQYFLTIGIGGCFTAAMVPGTNAALLGGWALSAGLGSAFAAAGI